MGIYGKLNYTQAQLLQMFRFMRNGINADTINTLLIYTGILSLNVELNVLLQVKD